VDPKLVLAYIYVESRGVPDKPSKEYEYVADAEGKKQKQLKPDNMQSWGLMQLIPGLQGLTIQEAKNPSINIDRGTAYIAANLKAYPGKAPIQILGYNRGTRGAGKFEENGYAGKTEKNTAAANTYVASVLQAYSLLSESKFDSHKSESAGAFIKSQDYQSAMERCQKKTDGGYLAGFDFSQGFNYP
jgi:soluble lytic murein transglycosylase-like protein